MAAPAAPLPTKTDPRGTEPIVRLFDMPPDLLAATRGGLGGELGGELADRYDGDLRIPLRPDRPTVIANFVETLDGIVAMDAHGATGGGEVSGFSPTDRFVMGLLRALADVVLVGASTIRSSGRATWTPGGVFPDAARAYAALRAELGLAAAPTILIATSSGDLDPGLPVFQARDVPIVIAAPLVVAGRLSRQAFGANVTVEPTGADGPEMLPALVDIAWRLGARVILSEAGPHLFAALVGAGLVDELFVTVSPQLAGRANGSGRLAMVEGAALWPTQPRWARLRSVRRAGDHLFQRYQFEESR